MKTSLPELTIGIEEEYQIIDPETRELKPFIQKFLEQGQIVLQEQIKAEQLQCQVEVGSDVCRTIGEARQELIRLRRSISHLASRNGLRIAAASTHPFSSWQEQDVTEAQRYIKLQENFGDVARRMLIFGMHVHVGVPDKDLRIDVMDQSLYFLPHLLALSTSSPLWQGRKTGLKSYRSVVFESLPRTGLPPSLRSYAEYERLVNVLVRTKCIEEPTQIWWDVRPHPKFPTIEFRVCDVCTKIEEALCLTALFMAIVGKLIRLRRNNQAWRRYPRHLLYENKWRAMRYGIDGKLIDFGKAEEVPLRFLTLELMEFVDDVLDELGIRKEAEYVHTILAEGTSADRQLNRAAEGDLNAVVDGLIEETREGCD